MSEKSFMGLGQNIAELRKLRELTQRDLAKLLGVSQSHVAKWETDKAQPRSKALERLAEALDVTVEEILAGGLQGLEKTINIQDQELLGLLKELQHLSDGEIEALKTVIRGLLARSRIERSLSA